MSKVRLLWDSECHEVGMETNPNLCTYLHIPRTPATGRQSWGLSLIPSASGRRRIYPGQQFRPKFLSLILVMEGPWRILLSCGGLELTAGGPWT